MAWDRFNWMLMALIDLQCRCHRRPTTFSNRVDWFCQILLLLESKRVLLRISAPYWVVWFCPLALDFWHVAHSPDPMSLVCVALTLLGCALRPIMKKIRIINKIGFCRSRELIKYIEQWHNMVEMLNFTRFEYSM